MQHNQIIFYNNIFNLLKNKYFLIFNLKLYKKSFYTRSLDETLNYVNIAPSPIVRILASNPVTCGPQDSAPTG